jgi:hypothetical protein
MTTRDTRRAFRVLKPSGRFAVADVVIRGEVPSEVCRSLELSAVLQERSGQLSSPW